MLWFHLALLGAFLLAASSILDKHLLEKHVTWPGVPVIIAGFLDVVFAIALFFSGFVEFSLSRVSVVLMVSGSLYYFGNYLYYRTVEREDISNIVPLIYFRPLFVTGLAALALGEVFGVGKYFGILLVAAGAVLMGSRFRGGGLGRARGIGVLLFGVLAWSVGDVVSKWGLGSLGMWEVIGHAVVGFGLCSVLLFANGGIRAKFFGGFKKRGVVFGISSLIYLVILSGWMLMIAAMDTGPVSLVSSVQSLQVLFVLLITLGLSTLFPKFLKEEVGLRLTGLKLLAIVLIVLGVYLIA